MNCPNGSPTASKMRGTPTNPKLGACLELAQAGVRHDVRRLLEREDVRVDDEVIVRR